MQIAIAQINPVVGDLEENTAKICEFIKQAKQKGAEIVLFPELALSGYPPEDLLLLPHFIDALDPYLDKIVGASAGIAVVLGMPRRTESVTEKFLYNSAAIISNQKLLGFHDKILLPTYDVFDERRYFEPGNTVQLWDLAGVRVGITVCEDLWQHSKQLRYTAYRADPVLQLQKLKPDLVLNLSSSPFNVAKPLQRGQVCAQSAAAVGCPVAMCNQVGGNDSLIFDGHSLYVGSDGIIRLRAEGFKENLLLANLDREYPPFSEEDNPCHELFQALVLGVKDYFYKQGFRKALVGVSGGIDSALVACIAVEALGRENVMALSMPSRFTSQSSIDDAKLLAENLGISHEWVSIEGLFESYLKLLEPHFQGKSPDTTEENVQARIRGMILMAFSNKHGYIVLSTGNKSETALGYATLYGDLCGGLSVINDVTKMQVYALSKWINRNGEIIPSNIITKEPSAELKADQKDSDSLPPYEIIDTVVRAYIEEHSSPQLISKKYNYPKEVVEDIVHRIHQNEYKRRQSPPGLRVSERAFSIGRRFPIVQKWDWYK